MPDNDKKCRYNSYDIVSHLYIIVSSKVLYTHSLLKHRAGLYIELGGDNKLIDTGPHDLKGRFVFEDNVKYKHPTP